MTIFSGSYSPCDVTFLLRPIRLKMTPIEEKETLIQSGKAHYSDMLSQEPEPSLEHLAFYHDALKNSAVRLANEVMTLALRLSHESKGNPIVLVSLVRAGVPLGVMLNRALKQLSHVSFHYGISIIRDRGIDQKALSEIEQKHGTKDIVFVDGWTGKGTIAKQLAHCLAHRKGYPTFPRLVVLADPCGMAWLSASHDDWLIPHGILGAAVSGLISRTVWSADDYHGCVICEHLKDHECSTDLVNRISFIQKEIAVDDINPIYSSEKICGKLRECSDEVIKDLQNKFNIKDINRIKPGIAEATRALLRRVPDHVLVKDIHDKNVSLLIHLALKQGIEVREVNTELGQYCAVTIIKKKE